MKPQIPWLRVFVEGVVIVGSILLAFGIDAWWDGRQANSLEADILSALSEEVTANQATLRRDWEGTVDAITLTDRFLASDPGSLAHVPSDSVFFWAQAFSRPLTFDPSTGTAALLSQTSLLSSEGIAVRALVTEWLARLADLDEERESLRQRVRTVQDELAPYAARAVEHGTATTPEMIASLGPSVLSEMRRDQALAEALVLKAGIQHVYLSNLERLQADLDSLSAALSPRLPPR